MTFQICRPTEWLQGAEPDDERLLEIIYELRMPLTSIRAVLGLMQTGVFGQISDQGQQMLELALNNSDRLMRLIGAMEQNPCLPLDMLTPETMARLRLETDLRQALARQELQVYYQPITCLETDTILGFEALARWQHATLGMITPAQFIPIAEETGLIVPLGEWILRQACQQLKQWQQQFPQSQHLTISVNLSSQQLANSQLLSHVLQILQETGLPPHSLKLEVTEGGMLENATMAVQILSRLQEMGIQIYVDDFGTGYSSLNRLHQLPIDALKIDRSFIHQIDSEATNLSILSSIISLAQRLNIEIIAEGIEAPNQVSHLKSLGCKIGQGYLFSRPVDWETATRLLDQKTRIL